MSTLQAFFSSKGQDLYDPFLAAEYEKDSFPLSKELLLWFTAAPPQALWEVKGLQTLAHNGRPELIYNQYEQAQCQVAKL